MNYYFLTLECRVSCSCCNDRVHVKVDGTLDFDEEGMYCVDDQLREGGSFMKITQRIIREAKRHSLFFLASVFASIIGICGTITGIQLQDVELFAIFGIFTALLAYSAIYHAAECWRHLGLWEKEIQYKNENQI